MHATCTVTTVAEYDLLNPQTPTSAIEGYFRKPLATWDPQSLEPGEVDAVKRAFVRSTETRQIEIDREEDVIWVTYTIAIDLDYDQNDLEYFGSSVDEVLEKGVQVSFPLDERVVELVGEEITVKTQ
ncbi:MAG TPA: hypothetical protein ENN56_03865 [Firmicutes bacterium]|nr:hypothetical protein [Bacillota bacterium]